MAKDIDFSGPYLKTERAEHHIRELERIFERYIATNKKALTPKYNRKPRRAPLGGAFPKHTPTVLGDALHNLRAALDHGYCELVKANGHAVHERSFFPIVNPNSRDTWEARKASIEGHEEAGNGPGEAVIKALSEEVQPYTGGNGEDLVRLHVLDIADKHMILLPTNAQMHVEDIRFVGGGGITGLTIETDPGFEAVVFEGDAALDPKHHQKASFEICFGRGQPYEGKPITPILKDLLAKVNDTLRLLEQRAKETL